MKANWVIQHSAKGSTWEDHKYIKRDDGVYYYPDGYEGGRHLSDAQKKSLDKDKTGGAGLEDWEKKIHQHVAGIVESHPELFKSTADISKAILTPANTQAFKNTLKAFGLEPDKMSESELNKVRSKIAGYYSDAVADVKANKGDGGKSKDKDQKADKKTETKKTVESKNNLRDKGFADSRTSGGAGSNLDDYKRKLKHSADQLEHHGILGMKWGVRRYQNKDGSLTALGRKRYVGLVEYDNNGKPVSDKAQSTANTLARTSAEKDFKAMGSALNNSSQLADKLEKINNMKSEKKRAKALAKLNISQMSDEELRAAVNRMNLERNFAQLASSQIKTGRERTGEILSYAGSLLALGGTAASIALAIHQLKHG